MTASDGATVRLRERLGHGLLVVLVAPGTGVWDRKHWMSAGLMPQLADAAATLPLPAEVLVAEGYPGAVPHTVLVVRPDGHLVAALSGVRPADLRTCADALRGGEGGPGGTPGRGGERGGSGGFGGSGSSRGPEGPGAPGAAGVPGVPGGRLALEAGPQASAGEQASADAQAPADKTGTADTRPSGGGTP